ncbi:hypothetical protein E4T47_03821 [Aureobasidium subglaciale]|nr:hypothetical protein E4T47_03821 [Aureobasidium subglaciale]
MLAKVDAACLGWYKNNPPIDYLVRPGQDYQTANTKMHFASTTLLLFGILQTITNALPAPLPASLPSTFIFRSEISPRTQSFVPRQAGCNIAQCNQCRKDAQCVAGTPAW